MSEFIRVIAPGADSAEDQPAGRRGLRVVEATVGIDSNNPQLLDPAKFSLLLTDFHRLEVVPFDDALDAHLYVYDDPEVPPRLSVQRDRIVASGAFSRLEDECSDPRFSLFGNEGLLFRYLLALLEDRHGICSFHACAMYQPDHDHLLIIAGGAGSGKSCFLMSALEQGLQIFATEMVHFRIGEGLTFFKGSLLDNVRLANLKLHYPDAVAALDIEVPEAEDEWSTKLCVDLSGHQVVADTLVNPTVTVVLPHIEQQAPTHSLRPVTDPRLVIKALYDKAAEKVAGPVLLYESLPMPPLQGPRAAARRLEAVARLAASSQLSRTVSVYAGPTTCLEGLLQ